MTPPLAPRPPALLLVDDEGALLRAFTHAFEKLGFRVRTATNADEAIACWRAEHERIDILVTDVQMPGTPVESLIAEVRAGARRVPILLMSGELRGTDARIRALMASVDRFLPKPLRIHTLRAEVEHLLAEHRA